jgi:hypothetical protein
LLSLQQELNLKLYEVIWKDRFIAKIEHKHGISTQEVEEVLFSNALFRRAQKGRVRGEDLYVPYGQTEAGRTEVL